MYVAFVAIIMLTDQPDVEVVFLTSGLDLRQV